MSTLIDEFREEVAKEVAKKLAVRMLSDKLPLEKVVEYSGLTIEEVTTLQKEFLIEKSSDEILMEDEFALIQDQSAETKIIETENEDTKPVFYKSSDVARILGCSMPIAYQIMHRNDFPLIKMGSHLRVYKNAFEKWAMECRD